MKRFFALLIVVVLLAGLVGGLGYFQFMVKPQMIKGFIAAAPRPPATVAVVEAKSDTWTPQTPAIGTLRATLGIDVAPQVGGIIRAVRFQSGEDVAQGALLVEIDDAVEQADLKSNVANLKNADLSLDRQKQLIAGGSTAKSSVDSAQAMRDQAAAAVDRSKALIAQKALVAPFAGRLGLRKFDVGQYLSPGASMVTLQQLDPIYVDFPLPEQNLANVRIGQDVNVDIDAWPKEVFHGKVRSIDARVSSDTRNVLIRAELPNRDKRLKPGMFAGVNVLAGAARQLVTVPRTAVSFSLYGDSVFVVKPAPPPAGSAQAAPGPSDQNFIVERRTVKTGDVREDQIAILEGVAAGDKLVSEGQLKLQPNMPVRVDNSSALPPPPAVRPKE